MHEAPPRRADSAPDLSIFPDPNPPTLPLLEGAGDVSSSGAVLSSADFAHVDLIRVEVLFEGDVAVASYAEPDTDAHVLASLANEGALETARRAVAGLAAWIRVAPGQPWLGLSGEEPWPEGRSRLEDLDASRRLPYSLAGGRLVIQRIADGQILRVGQFGSILERVEAGDAPTLADSVLADAMWLNSHPRDTPRVVLTAAIACELRVKHVLRGMAKPEAAELLDVLLESPRDFSVGAAALFHRPIRRSSVGRSTMTIVSCGSKSRASSRSGTTSRTGATCRPRMRLSSASPQRSERSTGLTGPNCRAGDLARNAQRRPPKGANSTVS
jgi:hypothetical protein